MRLNFPLFLYILILLITPLVWLVLGFTLIHFFPDSITALIFFSLIVMLWTFILIGWIGPKKLKTKMREFQIWLRTKAVIFFPVHPYQPIDEALKGGVGEFLPTKERVKNWFVIKAIGIFFSIILVASLFLLYRFLFK